MSESAASGHWPRYRSSLLDWLVRESVDEPFLDNMFAELCRRLVDADIPVTRATLHLRTLHPQFAGARILWQPGFQQGELLFLDHGIREDPRFLQSPVHALYDGADALRHRLDIPSPNADPYPILTELRERGFTDYVAMPLLFTLSQRHAVTWATSKQGGFTTDELLFLADLMPAFAMAAEIRLNRRMARNLLDAYVGKHAGERILAGEITRGSGATIHAVIWNCDIRGFTELSEHWPRDDVIAWLNDYFDAMVEPVERHGGEILKFIGDGMLAVFPLADPAACSRAMAAAIEGQRQIRELNSRRRQQGRVELGHGIALHVGDVMYGNIGSRSRLDFTVIGPAVNVAARMQGLCKDLCREILVSEPFAAGCPGLRDRLVSLGRFPLRGVGEPLEVLTPRDEQ